jgi:four helix bundle protein
MAVVKTYRELEAWRAGMDLVEVVYAVTRTFPREELFGITAQTRRAAISIPSNIAEGACRRTTPAFLNHVSIALGSHAEVETCLEIATRLNYLPSVALEGAVLSLARTGQLLNGLRRSLEASPPR